MAPRIDVKSETKPLKYHQNGSEAGSEADPEASPRHSIGQRGGSSTTDLNKIKTFSIFIIINE